MSLLSWHPSKIEAKIECRECLGFPEKLVKVSRSTSGTDNLFFIGSLKSRILNLKRCESRHRQEIHILYRTRIRIARKYCFERAVLRISKAKKLTSPFGYRLILRFTESSGDLEALNHIYSYVFLFTSSPVPWTTCFVSSVEGTSQGHMVMIRRQEQKGAEI